MIMASNISCEIEFICIHKFETKIAYGNVNSHLDRCKYIYVDREWSLMHELEMFAWVHL